MFSSSAGFGSAKQRRPRTDPTWMRFDGASSSLNLTGLLPSNMKGSSAATEWTVMAWVAPDRNANDGGSIITGQQFNVFGGYSSGSYNFSTNRISMKLIAQSNEEYDLSVLINSKGPQTLNPNDAAPILGGGDRLTLISMHWNNGNVFSRWTNAGENLLSYGSFSRSFFSEDISCSSYTVGSFNGLPDGNILPYEGYLRDFRVYNGEVTDSEFLAIGTAGPGGDVSAAAPLYLRYLDSEVDISGNNRDAANTGVLTEQVVSF